jgi:hypothetical protein
MIYFAQRAKYLNDSIRLACRIKRYQKDPEGNFQAKHKRSYSTYPIFRSQIWLTNDTNYRNSMRKNMVCHGFPKFSRRLPLIQSVQEQRYLSPRWLAIYRRLTATGDTPLQLREKRHIGWRRHRLQSPLCGLASLSSPVPKTFENWTDLSYA